jgi:thiamine pyrophosphokinase
VKALILADGDAPTRADLDRAWPGWDAGLGLVVAADGGARLAHGLGLAIDAWVGDGDSLDEAGMAALVAAGVPIQRSSPDKDESDTELAVREALQRGATDLVIVGALGGPRFDHALANIGLLAMADLADRPAALVDARTRITLIRAPGRDGAAVNRSLPGRIDDLVSLLPLGAGVVGVTTSGLAYPLADEPLPEGPARGLSNVRTAADAAVTVRAGLLLVVESPARLGP